MKCLKLAQPAVNRPLDFSFQNLSQKTRHGGQGVDVGFEKWRPGRGEGFAEEGNVLCVV